LSFGKGTNDGSQGLTNLNEAWNYFEMRGKKMADDEGEGDEDE